MSVHSAGYSLVHSTQKYRKILKNQHFWSNFVLCGGARYSAVLASFGSKSAPVLASLLAHFISHTLNQARQRVLQMLWFNLEYAARGNVERHSLLLYIHLFLEGTASPLMPYRSYRGNISCFSFRKYCAETNASDARKALKINGFPGIGQSGIAPPLL